MSGALLMVASVGAFVSLENESVTDIDLAAASAQIKFNPDGSITNHNNINIGSWHTPEGGTPGSAYEIRATPNPDTPDAGTMNTWLALSSTRTWTENNTTVGTTQTKVFDIEIRPTSGSVIASCTVTLNAEVTA